MIRYADITLERRLIRFLLDILKSSLIGFDNSAWQFD